MELTNDDLPDIIAELESDPTARLYWEKAQLRVLTRKQSKLIAELRGPSPEKTDA
jgi:hypothetical protein